LDLEKFAEKGVVVVRSFPNQSADDLDGLLSVLVAVACWQMFC